MPDLSGSLRFEPGKWYENNVSKEDSDTMLNYIIYDTVLVCRNYIVYHDYMIILCIITYAIINIK